MLCDWPCRGWKKGRETMLKVGVLVSGGGTNLQAILDAIDAGRVKNAKVSFVFSNNANAYALERAKNAGIEAMALSPSSFETREEFNQAMLRALKERNLDLIVLAGFLVKIPPEMVEAFRGRIINIHPSLIPSFCGVGYYGLKVTGATVHYVDEGMDSGPIILQKAVEVKSGDTPKRLQQRVMEEAEWVILPQAIHQIANNEEVK